MRIAAEALGIDSPLLQALDVAVRRRVSRVLIAPFRVLIAPFRVLIILFRVLIILLRVLIILLRVLNNPVEGTE
jgi:hypothetical protein